MAKSISFHHYAVKGGKLPTMRSPKMAKSPSIRVKSLKAGKKVTSFPNPLAMKAN